MLSSVSIQDVKELLGFEPWPPGWKTSVLSVTPAGLEKHSFMIQFNNLLFLSFFSWTPEEKWGFCHQDGP